MAHGDEPNMSPDYEPPWTSGPYAEIRVSKKGYIEDIRTNYVSYSFQLPGEEAQDTDLVIRLTADGLYIETVQQNEDVRFTVFKEV